MLGTVEGLKRFVDIAPSPYHGLNLCLGTVAEMLQDPRREIHDVIRWFGTRGKIFNIHFRNIRGRRDRFEEVFPDEGDMDMAAVLRTLHAVDYRLHGDARPHAARTRTIRAAIRRSPIGYGYIKALIQAVGTGDVVRRARRGRPSAVRMCVLRPHARARTPAKGPRSPARERPNERWTHTRTAGRPASLTRWPRSQLRWRPCRTCGASTVPSASGRDLLIVPDGQARPPARGSRLASELMLGRGPGSARGDAWAARGAGRRPALVWPFGVRANAGECPRRSR